MTDIKSLAAEKVLQKELLKCVFFTSEKLTISTYIPEQKHAFENRYGISYTVLDL